MRKLIALLLVVAVLGIVAFLGFRVGPPPEIAIKPAAEMIGRKTPVTVSVSEPKRGVGNVIVELVQGDSVQKLSEAAGQPTPAWLAATAGLRAMKSTLVMHSRSGGMPANWGWIWIVASSIMRRSLGRAVLSSMSNPAAAARSTNSWARMRFW